MPRYRKLKCMLQQRLAFDAGMERSYVSDVERRTGNPPVRVLARLAEASRIEPKLLLKTRVGGAFLSDTALSVFDV